VRASAPSPDGSGSARAPSDGSGPGCRWTVDGGWALSQGCFGRCAVAGPPCVRRAGGGSSAASREASHGFLAWSGCSRCRGRPEAPRGPGSTGAGGHTRVDPVHRENFSRKSETRRWHDEPKFGSMRRYNRRSIVQWLSLPDKGAWGFPGWRRLCGSRIPRRLAHVAWRSDAGTLSRIRKGGP
jgi:hypothetical protein